jgi:PAS domain S-box-containing protein
MIDPSRYVLRWIPKRNPHWAVSFLITAICLIAAIAIRIVLIGPRNSTVGSSILFPALIVIALYAGWRWSLGVVTLITALLAWGVGRMHPEPGVQTWVALLLFYGSGILCIMVAGAVRELVITLDEERQARSKAEGHTRESEERFGALADSAPSLMWVTKPDRTRAFVNTAYKDYLGADHQDALNFDWRERLHPDDQERILEEQMAGEAALEPFTMEARYRRADGQWRWLRSISRPRRTPDGAFDGFIGIAFDVTDSKQAEADLKGINELLADRVSAAMTERDQAQAALMQAQKLEAVGQLTGGVAHDFNNLLTVIIGALDIIQRHPDDIKRRNRMTEAALAAARRGEQLNQQLLAFARREALHPTVIRLDEQLGQAETLMRRAVGESVELSFKLRAIDGHVRVDPGQLEAAVLNLLINARDAVSDGGRITLSTQALRLAAPRGEIPPGDYFVVSVEDDGEGMDKDTLAHVFEPFFTTKPVGKGTGLGLAQVYGFAKQSGGVAEVESVAGKGTTVRILLPSSADKPLQAIKPRAVTGAPLALKILLVEDDADVAELVEAMLKELGHKVVRASDARSALKITVTEPELELMLTDVIMPGGKNGVELAREVTEIRPGLPVILSSGYTGESLAGAEAAPWPLLRKPYTLEALNGVITDTIQRDRRH